MSVRAILHVGMPKCGSSALQVALSGAPELAAADGGAGARYVAIHASGELLQGVTLADRALGSSTDYVVSTRAAQLGALGALQTAALAAELAAAAADGARLVLSNEGWGNEYDAFREGGYLERLGLEVDVVLYVRPQVGWCNSAWWQWGAWTGGPFPRWLQKQFGRIQWGEVAAAWSRVPGVVAVQPRLLPADIVSDFCARAGVVAPPGRNVNASLSAPVLRLLQRHRELRKGPHDSAIEFALGRHLRHEARPAPWVLGAAVVESIIDACRDSNEALLALLDPDSRERMRADAAWWSADHWSARQAEPRLPQPAGAEESDALAADALAALYRLDASHREVLLRCRELERELAALSGKPQSRGLLDRLRRITGAG